MDKGWRFYNGIDFLHLVADHDQTSILILFDLSDWRTSHFWCGWSPHWSRLVAFYLSDYIQSVYFGAYTMTPLLFNIIFLRDPFRSFQFFSSTCRNATQHFGIYLTNISCFSSFDDTVFVIINTLLINEWLSSNNLKINYNKTIIKFF